MIYPTTYEQKVGFDQIRQHLTALCLCPLGEGLVSEMAFSVNFDEIYRAVKQTMEFVRILQEEDFPDQNFFDVRPSLKRIRIQNTCLEVDELFNLQRSLAAIAGIFNFLHRYSDEERNVPVYPHLYALTTDVKTYPQLVKRIDQILDKFGHVKDTASPTLMQIRRELAATAGSVSRALQNILKSAKGEGLVDKDISPTLRDGRLVIPVAPAMKRKIKGIVHDESDTGRTVFIEPAEVVEANNKIRELESEERKEIHRILLEFTQLVRPEVPDMLHSYDFLAQIDFVRAKAKFAITTNSTEPRMENKQVIDWAIAVHPLLDLKFRDYNFKHPDEEPRKVVPLDIKLNQKQRLLLISGPNAGGKSVCLKTTGLLQYMFQCGMPVPVAKSSVFGIFRSIFIDIGDEQSLENDLSTYSSHLLNMKNMMKHCDGASLILIDEFGGGTEPQIGGAMAEAMLKIYNKKHAFGVITTHYQNLKHYAQETEGIVNAAMLYDRQQMQPLFQLSIGNPGSSFAIEIARKTGIPDEVIRDASEIVGKDYINSDKYLQDIVRDKRYWEQKRQAIHQHEKQMEQTIQRYEEDIQKVHDERKAIIAHAKEEAEQMLKESNAKIEQTIKDIKEAQAEKERTRMIRQDLADFKHDIHEIDPDIADEKIRRQMEKLVARRKRKEEKKKETLSPALPRNGEGNHPDGSPHYGGDARRAEGVLDRGSFVRLKGQTTIGQIQKINGSEALVVFGQLTTNVKLKRLEPSEPPTKNKNVASTFVSVQTRDEIRQTTLNFKEQLDVRGMRGEEAVQAVTYFIDDACVARASRVKILHGTGTGALKTVIRQYLSTMPPVADFYDEDIRFGGAGITIVELV
ncbi:MAG: Smr/MutS family protein [Bacteroidaceae bacterium]|nr:Smr/MutS family protein [Bacteroidaceae bacterium]